MKKFVRENKMFLILILLFVLSETFHLLFSNSIFRVENNGDVAYYSNPIYYFMAQLGGVGFIPSIFIFKLIPKDKKSSRGLALGMILVDFKELLGDTLYLFKIHIEWLDRITLNRGFYGEIMFIILVITFTYLGFRKWNT